jgi:hypothetical protein
MVAYEEIEIVYHTLSSDMETLRTYPNIQSLIREACLVINDQNDKALKQNEMTTYARNRMLPSYTYFMTHFWEANAKRYNNLQLFKVYRILNPKYVKSLGDRFTTVFVQNHLRLLTDNESWEHLLSEIHFNQIIEQVAEYRRLCHDENYEDVNYEDTLKRIVAFWKTHRNELSAWWVLVEKAYLTQPSSCAAERALSVFTRIMTENMKNSLIDVIEGSMMVAFNEENDFDIEI